MNESKSEYESNKRQKTPQGGTSWSKIVANEEALDTSFIRQYMNEAVTISPKLVTQEDLHTLISNAESVDLDNLHEILSEHTASRRKDYFGPDIAQIYYEWSRQVEVEARSEKDVRIITATYCKLVRGLWMQDSAAILKNDLDATVHTTGRIMTSKTAQESIIDEVRQRYRISLTAAITEFDVHFDQGLTKLPSWHQLIAKEQFEGSLAQAQKLLTEKIQMYRIQSSTATRTGPTHINVPGPAKPSYDALPAFLTAEGVTHTKATARVYSEADSKRDASLFALLRGYNVGPPSFQDQPREEECMQIYQMHCNQTTGADRVFGRSESIVITGIGAYTQGDKTDNVTKTKATIMHIAGRVGHYDESPSANPKCSNGLRPDLSKFLNTADFQFKWGEKQNNDVPSIVVKLESDIAYGIVSTFSDAAEDGVGFVGEIQQMHISSELTPSKKPNASSAGTVWVQVLPYYTTDELKGPVLGYITGIPTGRNANPLTGACIHAVRGYLQHIDIPSNDVLLLLKAKWTSKPNKKMSSRGQDKQGTQESARMEPIIEIMFRGGPLDCSLREGIFRRHHQRLHARHLPWKIHAGGFHLELYRQARDVYNLKARHQWSNQNTPCTAISPIPMRTTAIDIANCLWYIEENRRVLHHIRGIHILPETTYGFQELRKTEETAIILWDDSPHILDLTAIEDLIQGADQLVIQQETTKGAPGLLKYRECSSWFDELPNDDQGPNYIAPTTIFPENRAIVSTFNTPSSIRPADKSLCRTIMTTSPSPFVISSALTVASPTDVTVHSSMLRQFEDLTTMVQDNMIKTKAIQEQVKQDKIEASAREAELRNTIETMRLAHKKELEEAHKSIVSETKSEITKAMLQAESTNRTQMSMDNLKAAHKDYLDAKNNLQQHEELFEELEPSPDGKVTSEQKARRIKINKAKALHADRLGRLREARLALSHIATTYNVDIEATLHVYNE